MIKKWFKKIGWATLVSLPIVVINLLPVYALEFDPGGSLGKTLGLGTADFESTVINITQWVLGLLGLVAVIMMIIGGFMYMTSSGNEEKVGKAKKLIKAALIGMVLVMLSYAIASFVFEKIQEASST